VLTPNSALTCQGTFLQIEPNSFANPSFFHLDAVRQLLARQTGVQRVMDLHVWATSTADVALTAHLVMPGGHPGDAFLQTLTQQLRDEFNIGHVTLQTVQEPFTVLCDGAFDGYSHHDGHETRC
jgi:hypothetical protein